MVKDSTKKLAIGTVLAAGAGYVAGILTAPKSGKETRKDIKVAANKGMAEAEKRLKKLHTQLSETMDKVKTATANMSGKAKEEAEAALALAKVAKEKARVVLSTVHDRGNAAVPDKDLQKAINDAQKAVDHLKVFLKK